MGRGSEAFKQKFNPSEEPEEEGSGNVVEGSGNVLPFKPRNESAENVYKYKEYKALGGILDEMEYQDVLGRIDSSRNIPPYSPTSLQAEVMAKFAGITLSPETVALYGVLRNDVKPDPDTEEHYSTLNDQKLFAEALRMVGDKDSLATFIEKHPHIFN